MQIALKALSSEFNAVVERARSKFISESYESKFNSESSDENEMILEQNLDVIVPKYIGTISFVPFSRANREKNVISSQGPGRRSCKKEVTNFVCFPNFAGKQQHFHVTNGKMVNCFSGDSIFFGQN